MVNYQLGKIYKIVCNITGKVYIGSTCETKLARRLAKHANNYNVYLKSGKGYVTSFELIKNGDNDIILIEIYPCNNKDELFSRERYWSNQIDCINKIKNQGLKIEMGAKEYDKYKSKIYYRNHKEKVNQYFKIYREKTKKKSKKKERKSTYVYVVSSIQ